MPLRKKEGTLPVDDEKRCQFIHRYIYLIVIFYFAKIFPGDGELISRGDSASLSSPPYLQVQDDVVEIRFSKI